jgi:hypothetical protein
MDRGWGFSAVLLPMSNITMNCGIGSLGYVMRFSYSIFNANFIRNFKELKCKEKCGILLVLIGIVILFSFICTCNDLDFEFDMVFFCFRKII